MARWFRRNKRPLDTQEDYDTFGETATATHPVTYDRAGTRPVSHMIASIIAGITYLTEAVLALRFVFLLAGANSVNGFVSFIYNLSYPFIAPFQSIFGTATPNTGVINQSVFEPGTLIAMLVYGLIAGILFRLLNGASRRV